MARGKGKPHYIFDGYNLAFLQRKGAVVGPGQLEEMRNVLLENLLRFKSRDNLNVTVVFDGRGITDTIESFKGIKVRYSRSGETADTLIKELVDKCPHPKLTYVVSADREVKNAAYLAHCMVIDARDFIIEIESPVRPQRESKNNSKELHKKYYGPSDNEIEFWKKAFNIEEDDLDT